MRGSWSVTFLAVAVAAACSADDTVVAGADGSSATSTTSTEFMDARSERASSDGAGGGDTNPATADAKDSSLADSPADARDTGSAMADAGDSMLADAAESPADTLESGSVPADAIGDASGEPNDALSDAEAASSCRTPLNSDASSDAAAGPGTISNPTGYAATDVAYITWSAPAGSVPRTRDLELRFDLSPGVCAATLAHQRKANGSELRIDLTRANYLMWGTLPSFFAPGTYPLSENVYELDAGLLSIADVDLVKMDGSCGETFSRATSGSVTLTSVSPSHVAGNFTAVFDDAGTVSGGFDVDLCFDAELPDCAYTCAP